MQNPQRPGAGREGGDVIAAQRKPVALDNRRVAEHTDAGGRGGDEGLSSHPHMVPCPAHSIRQRRRAGVRDRRRAGERRRQDVLMAGLKDRLRADLTASMKARDEVRTRTLRMALTSVTNEEVSGNAAHELTDDDVLKLLGREA